MKSYYVQYGKKAKSHSEIPEGKHYAAVVFKTITYHEHDYYSRDGSGNNVSLDVIEYYVYTSYVDWEKEVKLYHSKGYDDVITFFENNGKAKVEVNITINNGVKNGS